MPTLYCNFESIPKSFLPSQTTGRVASKIYKIEPHSVLSIPRSSHLKVFLRNGFLKICSKFTGEHPCRNVISRKLLCNFLGITLRYGCSPVNLLHIFRIPSPRNTSEWLLLNSTSIWNNSYMLRMLHVKLFSVASLIPLPEWFRKGSECCLRKKSMLEKFWWSEKIIRDILFHVNRTWVNSMQETCW